MSTEILPKPGGQIVELTSDLVAAYVPTTRFMQPICRA
jgi:predicted transcriptional regulator